MITAQRTSRPTTTQGTQMPTATLGSKFKFVDELDEWVDTTKFCNLMAKLEFEYDADKFKRSFYSFLFLALFQLSYSSSMTHSTSSSQFRIT